MLNYYLTLGLHSLHKHRVLTALMVLTLAIGIAASMSTLTVLYMMSADPIPHKSDRLLVPNFDYGQMADLMPGEAPSATQLNYRDAANLLQSGPGLRRTALYSVALSVFPVRDDLPAYGAQGLATTRDFFTMFDVPLRYGAVWSDAEEKSAAQVVLLSLKQSQRLFGDQNPVGRRLRIGHRSDHEFTIVGVIDNWQPQPHFYHLYNGVGNNFSAEDDFVFPFSTGIQLQWPNNGNTSCFGDRGETREDFLNSDCVWIQFWIEAKAASDNATIFDALNNYVSEQKKMGRFARPLNNRLYTVNEWLVFNKVVADDSRMSTWLAFGFLLVCLVNMSGLLLAKFSTRAGEIGVRRALGARQRDIFLQFSVETLVVGGVGGLLGVLLSFAGLWLIGQQSADVKMVASMDTNMLLLSLLLSLFASLLAGLFPTWRACQVTPAIQLKSQ